MKISCPSCRAAFQLDDARVPPAGLSIKCPKCKGPFTVHRPKPGEEGKIVEGKPAGAVPLPGTGAPPAAGAKAEPPGGPAVPLPGMGAGGTPQRGQGPGAIPLPGQEGGQPRSASQIRGAPVGHVRAADDAPAGAIPLPGDGAAAGAGPQFDPTAIPLPGQDGPVAATPPDPFGDEEALAAAAASLRPPPKEPRGPEADPFALVDDAPAPAGPAKKPATVQDDGFNFDFVEPPSKSAPRAVPTVSPSATPSRSPELLDFVDERAASAKKPVRAPPVLQRGSEEPEELLGGDGGKQPRIATASEGKKKRAGGGKGFRLRAGPVIGALLGCGLLAFAVLGVRAGSTPAGLFWRNRFFTPAAPSAATSKVLNAARIKLDDGSFGAAREALGAAAQLLAVAPKDEEAKAFFVLCASEMRFSYGQGGADWDQSKRVVDTLKGSGPSQQRARAAHALASGDAARARTLIAALGDQPGADPESVWLYAQALLRSGEAARAAELLDNTLKTREMPKLLLARGLVEAKRGTVEQAARWFEKVLGKAPDSGRALIELAQVKIAAADLPAAAALLDRALGPEVRKTLDATEEARASMLRGRLLASQHDSKQAEIAFERAVTLDPGSIDIRAAYGSFRLQRREYEKAARQFDAALRTPDVPAAVLGDAARTFLRVNRWVEADKRAAEAVAKDPANPSLLYVQARVTEVLGKGEEASKLYEKALAKAPDLAEALIAKGELALARGEKGKAKEALDQVLKTTEARRSASDYEGIGDLSLALGDTVQAKEAFAAALRLDPEDPQAHAGLGRALAALGNLKGARDELEQALRQADSDASMHYQHGSLLRRIGESDNALAALQKAVALDGKDARYRARLGALLVERGEFEKGEEQLKLATLADDNQGEAWFFLGRSRAGLKRLGEAVETLKRAVEIEPTNAEYLYHLGLVYEAGQQVQNAVDSFHKSLAHDPKKTDAHEHLGTNLMVQNRYVEAVDAFKQATQLAPTRPMLWALLGDAMQQAGELDGAIGSFLRALRQDSSLPGVWTKLGIAYKDKACSTCKTHAIESLRRATLVDAKDAPAWHELGYLYKDEARRADSIAAFRKYLELKPNSVDAETVNDEIYYLQEESRRAP
jgi:predicted Zn finger-like uncharacterized protein